jgi:hypothetical protein
MTTAARPLFLIIIFICFGSAAKAQTEQDLIQKTIERFFIGFSKADTAIIFSAIDKNFTLQTVYEKNGKVQIHNEQLNDFIETIITPKKETWFEKIESYDIKIDRNFASAWCKYTFYVDTTFIHWGIDNFQLLKADGEWKIFSIVDTRNKKESYHKNNKGKFLKEVQGQNNKNAIAQIDFLLNNWHKAAANADEKVFFESMDSLCIYLGTDKTENWTKQEFESWSKNHFEKDKAWDFTPYDRHIYFSEDKKYAWFDELLKTWMGISRGSGVVRLVDSEYKLMHYNLAVTVPNEQIKKFVKINK